MTVSFTKEDLVNITSFNTDLSKLIKTTVNITDRLEVKKSVAAFAIRPRGVTGGCLQLDIEDAKVLGVSLFGTLRRTIGNYLISLSRREFEIFRDKATGDLLVRFNYGPIKACTIDKGTVSLSL